MNNMNNNGINNNMSMIMNNSNINNNMNNNFNNNMGIVMDNNNANNNMNNSMYNIMPNNMSNIMTNFSNNNIPNNQNNNMNISMINNMPNSMNNIIITNMNNNCNNNMNNNMAQSSQNLKSSLYNQFKEEKNPYIIQKGIALGLNNNQNYQRYDNGNKVHDFNKFSSTENPQVINNINKAFIVNIIFSAMKGNIHSRTFDRRDTIKNMLLKFIRSVGLSEYHLDKIYFLFNSSKLNNPDNQKKTIEEMGIRNGSKVTIIDVKDIIGA